MTLRKFELIAGFAVILGVASYAWIYHFSANESDQLTAVSETVANEVASLSGLKVKHEEFSPAALADPYTHLAVNGEKWFIQSSTHFDSEKTLFEFPAIAADAWYAPANIAATLSTAWVQVKADVESYFSEVK